MDRGSISEHRRESIAEWNGSPPALAVAEIIKRKFQRTESRRLAKKGGVMNLLAKCKGLPALCALGLFFGNPDGAEARPTPEEQACNQLEKQAKRGSGEAQYELALCYAGAGKPINVDLARQWLEQAAENGVADAINNLGVMHERGESVPASAAMACELYKKAGEQGSAQGAANFSDCYYQAKGGLPQDLALSAHWLSVAIDAGDVDSYDVLAARYDIGEGVQRDAARALLLREKRFEADQNGATSYAIATHHLYGIGTKQDVDLASTYFERSSAAGFAPAAARKLSASANARVRLEIEPCWFQDSGTYVVSCGRMYVPENWAANAGPVISFPFVYAASAGAGARKAEPVVELGGGGPGASLLGGEVVADLDSLSGFLNAGHEVLLVDLRGSGRANPVLRCDQEAPEVEAQLAITNLTQRVDSYAKSVRTCLNRFRAAGYNLENYRTADAVEDLDALRAALGYERWIVLGVSYAARVAAELAAATPSNVSAAILDSPALHDRNPALYGPDVDRAFERLTDACRNDARCSSKYGDVKELLRAVVAQLNAKPLRRTITHPHSTKPLVLTIDGGRLLEFVVAALYSTQESRGIPRMLKAVGNGAYDLLDRFASSSLHLYTSNRWSEGLYWSTYCQEDAAIMDYDQLRTGYLQSAHFRVFPILNGVDERICAEFFPDAQPIETPAARIVAPILVFHGYLDPVTPYDRKALEVFTSSPVWAREFPDLAHGVLAYTSCADEIAAAFLLDPTNDPFKRACFDAMKPLRWGESD